MSYIVQVVTGHQSQAEDTEVFISLNGTKGAILHFRLNEKHSLKQHHKHLFQAGHEDAFRIDHDLIGQINVVHVDNRPNTDQDWFLESITVEDSSGTSYQFPCHNWLSANKDDGRGARSLLRGPLRGHPLSESVFHQQQPQLHMYKREEESVHDAASAEARLKSWGTPITFQNWSGNITVPSVWAFYPTTVEDIQEIVRMAALAGKKVRTCGATHSWSMLYADEDQVLIDPQYLGPASEQVVLSADKKQVTVMANATILQVKRMQLDEKFNFMFNVLVDSVTYGGIVNTGCHGVGGGCPALCDLVEELQVVDDKGDLVTYSKENDGVEFMKAVSTNLGLFVFVYKMTLNVQPSEYIVESTNEFKSIRSTLNNADNLKALVESHWSTEIFWTPYNSIGLSSDDMEKAKTEKDFGTLPIKEKMANWDPLNDDCWLKFVDFKPGGHPEEQSYYFWKSLRELFQHNAMNWIAPKLVENPHYTPAYCWLSNFLLKKQQSKIVQQLPHAIHFLKHISVAPVYDMEFAFVVDDDYENVSTACKVVYNKIKEYKDRNKYPMNICLGMRFMGASDSLLCPAVVGKQSPNEKVKTLYIEILTMPGTPDWKEFCEEIAMEWCKIGGKKGVKPLIHWAKEVEPVPNLREYMWENNRENMEKFLGHLSGKVDMTKKLFFNDFLTHMFTDPRQLTDHVHSSS